MGSAHRADPPPDPASRFRDRRVLITGGLSFIGSTLARRLAGAGVTIVDSLVPDTAAIAGIERSVEVNISDVRDPHNPRIKIVFASTRQLYGRPDYLPVDERHLLRPVDVNGVNKMAGEWFHILYNNVHGMRACALRLTNTIGPRMRVKDARQTFVGIWIRHLVEGRPFEVWGGEQLRDFTYVDDAVDAFLLAADSDAANGRIFNLGGDKVVSLRDLAEILARIGRGATEAFVLRDFPPDRKAIDIGDYYSDFSAIRDALGWRPHVSLEEGLARTVTFYREHLARYL